MLPPPRHMSEGASTVATSAVGYDRPALNNSNRKVPSMNREIRSYDYVNHPYAAVRDALVKDPAGVLRAATNAAASRARAVAAALHVNIGPLDIGAEIAVTVGKISEQTPNAPFTGHAHPDRMVGRAARSTVSHHERRVVGLSADGN